MRLEKFYNDRTPNDTEERNLEDQESGLAD